MKAILEAGIRIPEEIKVIGVGNVHYSDLLRVPLSTIDQSSTSIGQQAADMLVKAIGNKRKTAGQDDPHRPDSDSTRIDSIERGHHRRGYPSRRAACRP